MDYTDLDKESLLNELNLQVKLRKSAEKELWRVREERDGEVSRFMSEISYKFCTLMNGLKGMTDLVLETNMSPEQAHYLCMIRKSVERMLPITHDIKKYFEIETQDPDSPDHDDTEDRIQNSLTQPDHKKSKNLKILVAEDDDISRMLLVDLIERNGCAVTGVENGLEAIEALEKNKFDLILMDVQMPEIDGFELTRVIRENEKRTKHHIPIVAVTAHTIRGCRDKCLEAGMDDYIPKPIDLIGLLRVMERQLNRDQ